MALIAALIMLSGLGLAFVCFLAWAIREHTMAKAYRLGLKTQQTTSVQHGWKFEYTLNNKLCVRVIDQPNQAAAMRVFIQTTRHDKIVACNQV